MVALSVYEIVLGLICISFDKLKISSIHVKKLDVFTQC